MGTVIGILVLVTLALSANSLGQHLHSPFLATYGYWVVLGGFALGVVLIRLRLRRESAASAA